MGLYLLNLSVDTIEHVPSSLTQNLSVNDQESIVELLVEKVLGYEDAIKEVNDYDREEHNEKKNTKIDFLVYELTDRKNHSIRSREKKHQFQYQKTLYTSEFTGIDTPPPKF